MTTVNKNIIANFTGSGWAALMGIIFLPFYIRLMGAEAYGIVGVFVSFQAIFTLLDLGLSQSLNREMARLSTERKNADLMADTARTLEIIYWGIACGIIVIIVLLSDIIAYRWLKPDKLSRESLTEALWVMAVVIGFRWPVALYMGGLNGLQKQILVNILLGIFATLQGVGALAVLTYYEPTIRAYFLWQTVIAVLQVLSFKFALQNSFSASRNGAFSKKVLKGIWKFAAGLSGISLLVTVLTQLDKILLSKLLSLSEFGYYSFAASVAIGIYKLITPVFNAYYPRFTALVFKNDQPNLTKSYHQACQLMAVVLLPLALTIAFFSKEILELWARDPELVNNSYLILSLLIFGNSLNGLMNVPYALQLANGWTKLAFYQNLISVIVFVPIIYFSTLSWGAIGAAGAWIALNSGYLLIGIPIMHIRLLKSEKWHWYFEDIGKPLIAALIIIVSGKFIFSFSDMLNYQKLLYIIFILGLATLGVVGSSKLLRQHILPRKFMGIL